MPATASAMGLGLASVTPDARKTYNLGDAVNGVVITKVDPSSDAADKGLQPGDVVMKVGSRLVKTPQDVQAGIAEAQKGGRKSVLLLVTSQGASRLCRGRYRHSILRAEGRKSCCPAPRAGGSACPPSLPSARTLFLAKENPRMRILVVEDDLEAQRYLVQGLKESGHVVDDAADGDLGLVLALSRPYDVAIIDRMLPKMDGLGVVAEMREHGNTTPVLFLRPCPKWMTGSRG